MDLPSSPPSTSYSPSSSYSSGTTEGGGGRSCLVSQILGKVVCAVVTCVFAVVGSSVGAITGALIGLATESGLLRGAGIGAISGAVFSIEVVESSLDLWNSRDSGIWSILYVLDIISSLLSGRLVREKVGPAVQSAVQSQMSALSLQFIDTPDFFETGGIRGLSVDAVERIPKVRIAAEDQSLDAAGEKVCCSVCLQDFQIGEMVRRLPLCQHMFHLPCIDSWLIRHGSCPLRLVIPLKLYWIDPTSASIQQMELLLPDFFCVDLERQELTIDAVCLTWENLPLLDLRFCCCGRLSICCITERKRQ